MRHRIRNDWDDQDYYQPVGPLPVATEVWVDEDKSDPIPFGFQVPQPQPTMKRTPSRQARVARLRRGTR